MAGESILTVDDEDDILELLRYNLEKEGFQVICVPTGELALEAVTRNHIDLIILDLMLPGQDGFEVTKKLKGKIETLDIPIIMLTAKGEEADIVAGLELGADDYIVKPFSPRVLIARVRAVLRRKLKEKDSPDVLSPIHIHEFLIHPGRHLVSINGVPAELTLSEFQILYFLAKRPGWVFTRTQIVDAVHGDNYAVTDRSIDVQIVGLRKKLGTGSKYIETVRGIGYRFKEKDK